MSQNIDKPPACKRRKISSKKLQGPNTLSAKSVFGLFVFIHGGIEA